jgi:hypothetical protein
MAYYDRGLGPTVVLVHGSLSDYRYWMPQISSLSPHYRCYLSRYVEMKKVVYNEKEQRRILVAILVISVVQSIITMRLQEVRLP